MKSEYEKTYTLRRSGVDTDISNVPITGYREVQTDQNLYSFRFRPQKILE